MPRPRGGDRVLGPYLDQSRKEPRWRITLVVGATEGREEVREHKFFSSESDAVRYADKAKAAMALTQSRTIQEALDEYLAELGGRIKKESVYTIKNQCNQFFEGCTEQPLQWLLKPRQPEELYRALTVRENRRKRGGGPLSAAYHRNALNAAITFLSWCVERGWVSTNPITSVKPTGRRNRGKKQHRLQEAQLFYGAAYTMAIESEPRSPRQVGAIGVLTALLLSLRQSEVINRQVRDLDNDGRWLVIDEGKTKNSKGTLEIPDDLRPLLLGLAKGRQPDEPLFWYEGRARRLGRQWLLFWTETICAKAGVPRIVAHALRGQGASIGATQGILPRVISGALRHGNESVTRDHYIDPQAAATGQQRRLLDHLRPEAEGRLRALASSLMEKGMTEAAELLSQEINFLLSK